MLKPLNRIHTASGILIKGKITTRQKDITIKNADTLNMIFDCTLIVKNRENKENKYK